LTGSGWVAVRCWESRAGGRMRFAHTAPSYFEVVGQPMKPRRAEVAFLVDRLRTEIQRSADVLPPEAMAEYSRTQKMLEDLAATAE
jgi:hypothetical protein